MKKFKKNSLKTFWFFSIAFLACGSLVTFVSIFFNEKKQVGNDGIENNGSENNNNGNDNGSNNNENNNNSNESEENLNDYDDLDITKEIVSDSNLNNLTIFSPKEEYIFNKPKIDKNIVSIINNALLKSTNFTDEITNYRKIVRYMISANKKELIINLFLYNKIIKTKRYKSFFKLIIS